MPNWQKQAIEMTELSPGLLQELERSRITDPNEEQIVETEDSGNDEVDPNARFLSDKNQKAEVETRAQNVDEFKESEGSGLGGEASGIAPTGLAKEDTLDPEQVAPSSDVEVADGVPAEEVPNNKGLKRDWRNLTLNDLSVGGKGGLAGATDDLLEDVATGNRTILSTKEFRYFSYYHRIKVLLRQFWKPSVERKIVSMWNRGQALKQTELVTKLLVLLDKTGQIQKISRVVSSGVQEVDSAAMEAFQQAAPFPNPPSGIIDEDGFVRIRWDFILKAEASPAIQWRQAGPDPR